MREKQQAFGSRLGSQGAQQAVDAEPLLLVQRNFNGDISHVHGSPARRFEGLDKDSPGATVHASSDKAKRILISIRWQSPKIMLEAVRVKINKGA